MSNTSAALEPIDFDTFCRDYAGQHVCLIQGEVFDMSPVGQQHVDCVIYLAEWLRTLKSTAPFHIREEKPLYTLGSDPEPDLVVMPGTAGDARGKRADARDALLVIEVSDSSLRFDTTHKLPLYAEAQVRELWIVDIPRRRLEVHLHPEAGTSTYKSTSAKRGRETVAPTFAAADEMSVAALFGDTP